MGCIWARAETSQCRNCDQHRKYPNFKTKKTQHNYPKLDSLDIFAQAHIMSTMEESSVTKKVRTNDGLPSNVFIEEHKVSRQRRGSILGYGGRFRGCIVWFTGLSGAGKSTIAMGVEEFLVSRGSYLR